MEIRCRAAVQHGSILQVPFGLPSGSLGSLRVVPEAGAVELDSYQVNWAEGATFGLISPPLAAHEDSRATTETFIHLTDDDASRTNVFCQNVTTAPITVDLDLYDAGGTLLGSDDLILAPLSGEVAISAAIVTTVPAGRMLRHGPLRRDEDGAGDGDEDVLFHLSDDVGLQTDAGVVNLTATTMTAVLELRTSADALLDTVTLELPPRGHELLPNVFGAAGHPTVNAVIRVHTTTPGAAFMAFATVTDIVTRDAFEIPAVTRPLPLLEDGFETGDTGAWSAAAPAG